MKLMTRTVACVLCLPTLSAVAVEGRAQERREIASLCLRDETPAVSFAVSGSKKIASVCKGANNRYLIYRFGKPGAIELEYPDRTTRNSWAQFELLVSQPGESYDPNRALESVLTFDNHGFRYRIFENLDDARGTHELVMVVDGRYIESRLQADTSRAMGSIASLKNELAWQYAEDDVVRVPTYDPQAGAARAADRAAEAADRAAAEAERHSQP